MDIIQILASKYAGSLWTLSGDDYTGLTWLSSTPKPSEKVLKDLWPKVQKEIAAKAQASIDRRKSVVAKLEALGLTVDEVADVFGIEVAR